MPPQRMLVWCRCLRAAEALGLDGVKNDEAAAAAGFASTDALRKAFGRLGLKVATMREPGGFDQAMRLFVGELRSPRDNQDLRGP